MCPSLVGVVAHVDVSGTYLAGVLASHYIDMQSERAGENSYPIGLSDELPLRIAEATREVQDFIDDRAHRRPREHDSHFIRQRQKLATDYLEGDGVHRPLPDTILRCCLRLRFEHR